MPCSSQLMQHNFLPYKLMMLCSVGYSWVLYINFGPGKWACKRATWPKHFRW